MEIVKLVPGAEKKGRQTRGKVTSRTGISTWKVCEDTACGDPYPPHQEF